MPALAEPGARRATRWGDLPTRIISAAILAPLALAGIWFGGVAFVVMIAAIAGGMAFEWAGMCQVPWRQPAVLVSMLAVAGAAVAGPMVGGTILTAGLLLTLWMRGRRLLDPLPFGIPYIGIAAIALVWLRAAPEAGRLNVIGLILLIWGSDIGAYLVGRLIGGPKLAPAISPGKTWSGAVGGLAAAIVIALLVAPAFGVSNHPTRTIATASLLGIAAQAGDLLESRLKRHFGVKDSGHLIPGHGGLLDRLDAVLIAAPLAAILAWMAGPGVSLWQ